jgi:hypothetical protein
MSLAAWACHLAATVIDLRQIFLASTVELIGELGLSSQEQRQGPRAGLAIRDW